MYLLYTAAEHMKMFKQMYWNQGRMVCIEVKAD